MLVAGILLALIGLVILVLTTAHIVGIVVLVVGLALLLASLLMGGRALP